jgi:Protein of unknown function (DUF2778)
VACLVLGCAWNLYANVFGASVYPSMAGGNFDAPVIRRPPQAVAARNPQTVINNVFADLPEPAPVISAPATVASISPLDFSDRFGAAAPQSIEPKPQAETPKLALASAPSEAPKPLTAPKLAEAPKSKEPLPQPAPVQLAAVTPEPRAADARPANGTGSPVRDMAQRAKAAVMSLASNEKQSIVEKLWGKPQPQAHTSSLLSFASADASVTGSLGSGSLGPTQNPALAGNTPRYDQSTAVYDISAHMVYLPDGSRLEAHSGLGAKLDDPKYVHVRMHGATPPHLYDLKPRESLFHGVAALRLTPVGGEDAIYGRSGLLAHTYMLGPNGDSNGCVSFRDYNAFLNAYRNQGIKRLAVVARID